MVMRDITVATRESKLMGVGTFIDNATSMTHGADSVLGQAGMLGWDMRTNPLVNLDGVEHKGKNEITRFNPQNGGRRELMNGAIVGANFVPIQLEKAFEIGDYLMELGAKPITAGTLNHGKLAFCLVDLDRKILVGKVDQLVGQFLLTIGQVGQLSLKGSPTLKRLACTNEINGMVGHGQRNATISIRHTASAESRIEQARETLEVAHSWIDEVEEIAEKLVRIPMQNDQFVNMAKTIYPEPLVTDDVPNRRSVNRWSSMIDELESIFLGDGSHGDTTGGVGNTAWCGYNALTERIDWYRNSKPDKVTGKDNSELRTAQALGVVGQTGQEKSNILTQVQQFVDDNAKQLFTVS